MGTVFHPPFPVDGHGVSPTGGTVFHPPEPTENSIMALVCKTVTRARAFLTLKKAFNASGGGKPNSGRKKERPLAAYGAGRNHPRRGACRSPCPSLRLAGSTPFGDYVPPCLRHRLPLDFHSTKDVENGLESVFDGLRWFFLTTTPCVCCGANLRPLRRIA